MEENFRNSPAVLKVDNALLTLGNLAIGGELDERAYTEMHAAPSKEAGGCAEWVELDDVESKLKQCEGRREWAIICPKELKANVRKHLNTPLIFSFDEVQGLQYPKVIIWGLPDSKLFKEINDVLPDNIGVSSTKKHNPKDQNRSKFSPAINALHVAITRAEQELYIVGRAKDERFSKVNKCLKASMSSAKHTVVEPLKTSSQEWKEEAEKLERMGLEEQAKEIRDQLGEKSVVEKKKKKAAKTKKKSKKNKGGKVAVKVQQAKSPFAEYVEKAVKNISGNILTILKHSTCNKILYETKMSDGKTLYDVIMQSPGSLRGDGVLEGILRLPKGRELLKKMKTESGDPNSFKITGPLEYWQNTITQAVDDNDLEYLIGLHEIYMDLRNFILDESRGTTVTHYAASVGKHEILETLFKLDFDLNAPVSNGRWKGMTPAAMAALFGKCEVLTSLSKLGIDLNARILDGIMRGCTPAVLAVSQGRIDTLKTLSRLGVDLYSPMVEGKDWGLTPADIAVEEGRTEVLKVLAELGIYPSPAKSAK